MTFKTFRPVFRRFAPATSVALFLCVSHLVLSGSSAFANEIPWGNRIDLTATFDRAFAVHAADVDGDGDVDILAAAEADDTLAWWENTAGDGTSWTEHEIVTDLLQTRKLFTADFDGDGDIDVAGISEFFQDIRLYLNDNGDGTAWTEVTVDGEVPFACAVFTADVDSDGDTDIVGGGKRGSHVLSWWENDGTGITWTEQVIETDFTGPCSVAVADFDKDGLLDVVGGAEFLDEVAWFSNPGAGTTWTKTQINTLPFDEPKAVAAGDIDRDGDPDVIGAAEMGDSITWFENAAGDGTTWTEHVIDDDFNDAHDIFLTDLDGDGDLDALAASPLESPPNPIGAITWWDNANGDGSVWVRYDVDGTMGGARGVWAADVNGDGLIDALGAGENDRVSWWPNESIHRNAAWPELRPVDEDFSGARGVAAVDLDCDADLDIIAAAGGSDIVSWWENVDGDGETWSLRTQLASNFLGAWGIDAGDLDGDGDQDAVGAAETDNVISWFDNTSGDGSTWTEKTIDPSFDGARAVHVGDVDGDGDPDVVGAAAEDDEFAWWSNTAGDATTWSKTSISTAVAATHDGASAVRLADIDGDSDLDLVATSSIDNEVLFFENTAGDGSTWSATTINASFDGASSVWAADVDNDGDLDVIAAALDGDDVAWFENTAGDGSAWSAANLISDGLIDGPTAVAGADFDGDGDIDVAATESLSGGQVVWFENTAGDGSAWAAANTIADPFDGAAALAVADVDNNGIADLVGAAEAANDVLFLSNLGGQFGLDTVTTAPGSLGDSVTDDLFRIVARHNGKVGEQDMELASFELLLEETEGDPLTTNEARAILQNAFVYLDDGNGTFSSIDDTLVTTVPQGSIVLENGVFSIGFGDGDANVRVQQVAARTYFAVLQTTADYSTRGLFSFLATHLTESSSTAEDRVNDVLLRLEWARNDSTGLFDVNPFGIPEADMLVAAIVDTPDPVEPEGSVTYTITVRNDGDWKAENVRVTNNLPGGTTFVSTSGCAEDPNGSATCTLGDVSLLDTASFDLTVSLDPGTAGPLLYQATVASDTSEASPGNEMASESTIVQSSEADIGVTIGHSPGTYAEGETFAFAIQVSNSGPGPDPSVSVTDNFPAELTGVTWVCQGLGGAVCGSTTGGGNISENVSIPNGGFILFWARGTIQPNLSTALVNTVTISGTNDFNSTNDTAMATVQAGDFIFADGFESGNTNSWQQVFP